MRHHRPLSLALAVAIAMPAVTQNVAQARPAKSFTDVKLLTRNGSARTWGTLTLDAQKKFHYDFAGVTIFPAPPIDVTITDDELKQIQSVFDAADVDTLPAFVPDPRMLAGGSVIELDSTVAGKSYSFKASLDFYGRMTSRVKPLVDALNALRDKYSAARADAFKSIMYSSSSGFMPSQNQIDLANDGTVKILSRHGMGPTIQKTGQATPYELKAVKDAFRNADVKTLPKDIPHPPVADIPFFTLRSTLTDGKTFESHGAGAFYGSYANRIAPLVDALRKIEDRLLSAHVTRSATGLVNLSGGFTWIEENKSSSLKVTNEPFASILKKAQGKYVTAKVEILDALMFGSTVKVLSVNGEVNVNRLAIHAQASASSAVIANLGALDDVVVTGEQGSWYQVDIKGKVGFAAKKSVKIGAMRYRTGGLSGSVPGSP